MSYFADEDKSGNTTKPKKEKREKESAKDRRARKEAEKGSNADVVTDSVDVNLQDLTLIREGEGLTGEQRRVATVRSVTGVLASTPEARDVKFDSFSVMVGGHQLVTDSHVELNQGCRYGLIGLNGSGKSNILAALAQREVPLPSHIDVYHLHEEAPADELTGVEAVITHIIQEAKKLEELSEQIIEECGADDERLEKIFERIDELDPSGSEPRARLILSGLGFSDKLIPMDRKTKHMSGGWRMRVSLAKALFAAPSLLLLDEPTNHLDLEACVWLEEHLASYSKCLVVISHSEDFLNAVCTNTIWLKPNPLSRGGCHMSYYGGNYDAFVRVAAEEGRVQAREYEKQQADMGKLASYVRVNKANGNANSAKSKKKVLEKIQDGAVDKPQDYEPSFVFRFPECERLPPPVMPFDKVSFSYSGVAEDNLYQDLSLAVDYDSRIAIVGANGCGKSTLMKLMSGELHPTAGSVQTHPHLRLAKYHQHSTEVLDLDATVLDFMIAQFPAKHQTLKDRPNNQEQWRGYLYSFGFSTKQQTSPIGLLSDGQKSRLVFAMIAMTPSGILLLDEPTNHLDLDAVSGLAEAVKAFQGGVVLVSHDFRLIDQVANEIWLCEDKGVKRFEGSIREYKAILAKKMEALKVMKR